MTVLEPVSSDTALAGDFVWKDFEAAFEEYRLAHEFEPGNAHVKPSY